MDTLLLVLLPLTWSIFIILIIYGSKVVEEKVTIEEHLYQGEYEYSYIIYPKGVTK